ncbi:hypothetical protein NN561_018128 [Cricetulus griseus]
MLPFSSHTLLHKPPQLPPGARGWAPGLAFTWRRQARAAGSGTVRSARPTSRDAPATEAGPGESGRNSSQRKRRRDAARATWSPPLSAPPRSRAPVGLQPLRLRTLPPLRKRAPFRRPRRGGAVASGLRHGAGGRWPGGSPAAADPPAVRSRSPAPAPAPARRVAAAMSLLQSALDFLAGPGSLGGAAGRDQSDFVGQTVELGELRLRVRRVLAEGGFAFVYEA